MYDPIGGFNRIREQYLGYLETAFRISDPVVSAARRELLERDGQLCTEPYIEPIPRYRAVDWPLSELREHGESELPDLDGQALGILQRLIPAGLFDSADISLYSHQLEMMKKGLREASPGIVTSGTGSGKTESFLLPILAQLTHEANTSSKWRTPDDSYLRRRWWHDSDGTQLEKFTSIPKIRRPLKANPEASPYFHHRVGENRPAAVRSLILYPMNALVEDQLARIRQALDSPEAREVMDRSLGGNRFFFGRYTGQTPVTGFHDHPRLSPDDFMQRKQRSLASLFEKSVEMERTQEWIRKEIALDRLDANVRYLFPSVDGAELISRWDIQDAPPDILITNISMLGAMLNREVDSPVFESTRQWIESSDDAYFFLVLDELHLHRGTAGTEVAYLIRLLLHRLGLTSPEHQHKLRVLASSASLPTTGEEGIRSQRYLSDMFGSHGLHRSDGTSKDVTAWRNAVVEGEALYETPAGTGKIVHEPFESLVDQLGGSANEPVSDRTIPPDLSSATWSPLANALNIGSGEGDIRSAVVVEAAKRLTSACWSESDRRYRATSIADVAEQLFGDASRTNAVRGLLVARGLGDVVAAGGAVSAPSFRIHTFFRAIEGLYAPLDSELSEPFGQLSIERSYAIDGARPLDLLYCESCGVLLVGGRRSVYRQGGGQFPELTPVADNLEDIPERLTSDRFEEQTYAGYAVFFPTEESSAPSTSPEDKARSEQWREAWLDPVTGQIGKRPDPREMSEVHGYLYGRRGRDKHKRGDADAGTHVPYQCPSCETDYAPRRAGSARLSPIRHFRPGFAKTTQLLTSELFDLLQIGSRKAKLVSFSDSRQEAAKAALDIEGRHHEDLRRQLLFGELRALQSERPSEAEMAAQVERLRVAADALGVATPKGRELLAEASVLQSQSAAGTAIVGPLSEVLEDHRASRFRGVVSGGRHALSPLVRTYAELGVHPFDPAGVSRVRSSVGGEDRDYEWTELIAARDGTIDWRDRPHEIDFLNGARETVLKEASRNLTEALFSKTYFAMEETGLGYPCLSAAQPGDEVHELESALLRVFADAYRLSDSPFDEPKPILAAEEFAKSNRVRKFAEAVWGDPGWLRQVGDFLRRLRVDGHHDGLIHTAKLFVRLTEPDDPAWRCQRCGRVHLHLGVRRCTRCFRPLSDQPTTTAGAIAQANYIGRRINRSVEAFRLHCEELTGQTDDGPARQRAFRDVLIQDLRPKRDSQGDICRDESGEIIYQDVETFWPQREAIDVLTVTTTMEVGIDIGSLQAVVQANMPPQRFNYQQRVGRAGRRGQAFSMALTVCRTKSHDLHYFRNPRAMTGDVPPPPFLARSRPEIARRFLWKYWLNESFAAMRQGTENWPADQMRPPDIHGEFVPSQIYASSAEWKSDLLEALVRTQPLAEGFVAVLTDAPHLEAELVRQAPQELGQQISEQLDRSEVVQIGLGHTLAEAGLLPMYGMPTRVRNLYTGTRRSASGQDWRTIDRDVDLAIFEFAPGSTVIKDKRTHLCVGFTGPLPPVRPGQEWIAPFSEAFGDVFWMSECPSCRSWYREASAQSGTECRECGAYLGDWYECREPLGFRTDFRPQVGQMDQVTGARNRSVQAESFDLSPVLADGTNSLVQVEPATRTYRMNRGGWSEDDTRWEGFTAARYTHQLFAAGRGRQLSAGAQWFDIKVLDDSKIFKADLTDEGQRLNDIWLAAPKTTDVIQVAPSELPPGIGLALLERTSPGANATPGDRLIAGQGTVIRAAALSASYLIVYRAALELDVDPEEFDVIEPRMATLARHRVPVLQIADFLVNGAGLSSALGERFDGETPMVASLITSIGNDAGAYPLAVFAAVDHASSCRSACYRCLLRHSNQPVHGLLDWRLGLAFVGVLGSSTFACGLDMDFGSPALRDWHQGVGEAISALERRIPQVEPCRFGPLDGFRIGEDGRPVVVIHPLWDPLEPQGVLEDALAEAGPEAVTIDSFTLARRPWFTRDRIRSLPAGPLAYTPAASPGGHSSLLDRLRTAGLPEPVVAYVPNGAVFAPLAFAWPTATPQPTCFVDTVNVARDAWLVERNWAIFGPGEEDALIRHLSGV